MQTSFTYFLEVNGSILLFYLLYCLLFKSLTFFRLNRYFLLFSIGFSLCYPLIDLSQIFSSPAVFGGSLGVPLTDTPMLSLPQQSDFGIWEGLEVLLWTVSALMILRLVLRLFSLYRLHCQARPALLFGYRYRRLKQAVNPFSFWRSMYVNPDCHKPEELKVILQHEQVHISEYHTLDVLLAELMLIFCWINPAMWLMKRAISENLEFITDRDLLHKGVDVKIYQYSILKISQLHANSALVNNFNFSTIKTRIMMMNKKKTPSLHMLKYALVMPLMGGLLYACQTPGEEAAVPVPMSAHAAASDVESALYYVDGKELSEAAAKALKPEEIAAVEVVKGAPAVNAFGEKGLKGVVVITTKQNADAPAVKALQEKMQSVEAHKPTDSEISQVPDFTRYYVLVDGREAAASEVNIISPENIENMEVLKGKQAVERFGEKARNGAILLTTRQ